MTDIRAAYRMLARSPAFVAGSVACLALGLGSAVVVATVWQSVVVSTSTGVPIDHVVAFTRFIDNEANPDSGVTPLQFSALQNDAAFTAVTAVGREQLVISTASATRPRLVEHIDGAYFAVFPGVVAAGRVPISRNPFEVVISHRLATGFFGGDGAALGQSIRVGGVLATVTGVMSPSFRGVTAPTILGADVWQPQQGGLSRPALAVFGRLRPGVAQDEVSQRLRQADIALVPAENALVPTALRGAAQAAASAVAIVVLALLAVVAMNLTALLLARMSARQQDMQIRVALGANTWRAVAPFALQGAMLVVTSAVCAIPVATTLLAWLRTRMASDSSAVSIVLSVPDSVQWGVWATGVVLAAGLVGCTTLWLVRRGLVFRPFAPRIIGAQVAVSVLLLVVSAVAMRQVSALAWRDPGFDADALAVVRVRSAGEGLADVRRAASVIPGVHSVAVATGLPLGREGAFVRLADGRTSRLLKVDSNYFDVLGLSVEGRVFAGGEAGRDDVAVVSRSVAQALWAGSTAIGQRITIGMDGRRRDFQVIGVADDADPSAQTAEQRRQVYVPLGNDVPSSAAVVLRFAAEVPSAAALFASVGVGLRDVAAFEVETARDVLSRGAAPLVIASTLAGGAGVVGVAVMLVGLFAVATLDLERRRKSIAIMVAIGAGARHIVPSVVQPIARSTATGITAGLCAAALTVFGARRLLFALAGPDVVVAGVVLVGLLLSLVLACLWPTWRAVRHAPLASLREL